MVSPKQRRKNHGREGRRIYEAEDEEECCETLSSRHAIAVVPLNSAAVVNHTGLDEIGPLPLHQGWRGGS